MTWPSYSVAELTGADVLRVEDGNHGEYRPRPDEFAASGTAFIRAADLDGGAVRFESAESITATARARIRKGIGQPRDVLLSHKGTVGKVALAPADAPPFVCSPQTTFWRSVDEGRLLPQFLFCYLRSPAFQGQLASAAGSTDMAPYVSLTQQRELRVELPPLSTQRAIAEVLGALDDKIAANSTTCAVAERLAEALYYRVTAGATRVQSSKLLVPVLGGTPDRAEATYWSGEIPWVSAKDITSAPSGVVLDTSESISDRGVANSRAKPVPAGSVILTARGTVGVVARLGVSGTFNQSCYAFVPTQILPASYLYFMVKDAAREALSVAHGSVFSTITMRSFDALSVPDLRQGAIEGLEADLSPLLSFVTAHEIESRHLAELRDTLLPHLMSGRITVREAETAVEGVL